MTWAHHALQHNDRDGLKWGLICTVVLGALFTCVQAYEYAHAGFGFSENIYGATFFMATGFHGFHVLIGTIFLTVCLFRALAGHFKPEHHFGFEAAAWYWHFVDVVWLFLFACIYVWGAGHARRALIFSPGGLLRGGRRCSPSEEASIVSQEPYYAPCVASFAAGMQADGARAAASGKLFAGYHDACQERCNRLRSRLSPSPTPGDGPAVFIILIVGFIVVGLALWVEIAYKPDYWVHAALWFPAVIGLSLLLLRPAKGILLCQQYARQAGEGRRVDDG